MQVEAPARANRQTALRDGQATPAVLTFLREAKVGRVTTLVRPDEEWEEAVTERHNYCPREGRASQARPQECIFPLPFPPHILFICLFIFLSSETRRNDTSSQREREEDWSE